MAKRSFVSSGVTVADGRPASRSSIELGVVLPTGSTALAAGASVLSIDAIC